MYQHILALFVVVADERSIAAQQAAETMNQIVQMSQGGLSGRFEFDILGG